MDKQASTTVNVTVLIDGREEFSRDCNSITCDQTASGNLEVHATYPPVDMGGCLATGTVINLDDRLIDDLLISEMRPASEEDPYFRPL